MTNGVAQYIGNHNQYVTSAGQVRIRCTYHYINAMKDRVARYVERSSGHGVCKRCAVGIPAWDLQAVKYTNA